MDFKNKESICIICTNKKAETFISIYDNDFELFEKITEYLPVQLESKQYRNKAPATCCTDCADAICCWDTFYKRCKETQQKGSETLLQLLDRCDDNVANNSKERGSISLQTTCEEVAEEIAKDDPSLLLSKKQIFKTRKQKTCFFCDFVHEVLENLNEHLIDAHSEMIFCCDICNMYLPRLQLMIHMSEHASKSVNQSNSNISTLNYKFKCEKCYKTFHSLSGVKYHMNAKHVQLQIFKCEECRQKFSSKRVLLNHKRSIHSKGQRQYVCNECGKAFKTDSTLYTHTQFHKSLKPFQCQHCDKSFRLKHHFRSHIVQHGESNTQSWECNVCHKSFIALDNLRKHTKIHDQTLGDFVCHICGAKMKQKRYLREHMKKVHLQSVKI